MTTNDTNTGAPSGGAPVSGATAAPAGSQAQPAGGASATPPAQPSGQPVTQPAAPNPAPVTTHTEHKQADPASPPAKVEVQPNSEVAFKLPDAYKDKPWAKDIKTQDDLLKQIDTLAARQGVPDLAKATPEEREAYYATTRPKDISEYQFGDEGVADPMIKTAMGESLMKNGVSATQANAIIKDYQASEQALLKTMYAPEGMEKALSAAFGADWKKVTGDTTDALKGLMTPDDYKSVHALPNPYIALVYRTLGNVVKTYGIKSNDPAHVGAGAGQPAVDVDSQRQQLRDQIGALNRRPHTDSEATQLKQQLAATYQNDPRIKQR